MSDKYHNTDDGCDKKCGVIDRWCGSFQNRARESPFSFLFIIINLIIYLFLFGFLSPTSDTSMGSVRLKKMYISFLFFYRVYLHAMAAFFWKIFLIKINKQKKKKEKKNSKDRLFVTMQFGCKIFTWFKIPRKIMQNTMTVMPARFPTVFINNAL